MPAPGPPSSDPPAESRGDGPGEVPAALAAGWDRAQETRPRSLHLLCFSRRTETGLENSGVEQRRAAVLRLEARELSPGRAPADAPGAAWPQC